MAALFKSVGNPHSNMTFDLNRILINTIKVLDDINMDEFTTHYNSAGKFSQMIPFFSVDFGVTDGFQFVE